MLEFEGGGHPPTSPKIQAFLVSFKELNCLQIRMRARNRPFSGTTGDSILADADELEGLTTSRLFDEIVDVGISAPKGNNSIRMRRCVDSAVAGTYRFENHLSSLSHFILAQL